MVWIVIHLLGQLLQREGLSDAAACRPKGDPRDAAFLGTYSCWGVPSGMQVTLSHTGGYSNPLAVLL